MNKSLRTLTDILFHGINCTYVNFLRVRILLKINLIELVQLFEFDSFNLNFHSVCDIEVTDSIKCNILPSQSVYTKKLIYLDFSESSPSVLENQLFNSCKIWLRDS